MDKILVHLQCNRCKQDVYEEVEGAALLVPGIDQFFASSRDVFNQLGILNPIHRCTYTQIGGMSLIGIDLLDDRNSGMEPQLGNGTK